jgi:hypothetical protein
MVKVGPERLSQSKIPGIEPATFPLEGHCLNQLRHINQYYFWNDTSQPTVMHHQRNTSHWLKTTRKIDWGRGHGATTPMHLGL